MSMQELRAQLESVNQQIKDMQSTASMEIRQVMAEYDITIEEVFGKPGRRQTNLTGKQHPLTGVKKTMKYRHPESGAGWAGTGLKPKWLLQALNSGRTLEELRVPQ